MRRREFLGLLCSVVPGGNASAQLRRHAPRRIAIVHLSGTSEVVSEVGTSSWRAFFAELRQRGYIEGSTVVIDRYAAETGFWRHVPHGLIDFLARAHATDSPSPLRLPATSMLCVQVFPSCRIPSDKMWQQP